MHFVNYYSPSKSLEVSLREVKTEVQPESASKVDFKVSKAWNTIVHVQKHSSGVADAVSQLK